MLLSRRYRFTTVFHVYSRSSNTCIPRREITRLDVCSSWNPCKHVVVARSSFTFRKEISNHCRSHEIQRTHLGEHVEEYFVLPRIRVSIACEWWMKMLVYREDRKDRYWTSVFVLFAGWGQQKEKKRKKKMKGRLQRSWRHLRKVRSKSEQLVSLSDERYRVCEKRFFEVSICLCWLENERTYTRTSIGCQ